MSQAQPVSYPSLTEFLRQEREGLRRVREMGWQAVLDGQVAVMLSAEQARNLLLVGPGAIRKDIIEIIRQQLGAAAAE